MNTELYNTIRDIVVEIDKKRKKLHEEFKNTPQYRNTKHYRKADQEYLKILLERRNTLVAVLIYDYTGELKELEELINN